MREKTEENEVRLKCLEMAGKIENHRACSMCVDNVIATATRLLDFMNEPNPSETNNLLSKPLEELELTVRAYNCLKAAGIETVRDIVACDEFDLRKIPMLGDRTRHEIIEYISSLGFNIKPYS